MNVVTVYNSSTLQNFYDSNLDYINNKKMYIELNKIKNLVINANYLGNTNYTYTYTSQTNNDFFSLLIQKIGIMFPDSVITYSIYANPTNFITYIPNTTITYTPSLTPVTNNIIINWL